MVHIAQAPLFYEQDYYTPSGDGFHVYDAEGMKTGIVVCFDRHYPESIRTEALLGAELILIPTANVKSEPTGNPRTGLSELLLYCHVQPGRKRSSHGLRR